MNMNSRNVTYSTIGDYQLPNLTLPRQEKTLGKYGRLRRTYLMKHRPVLYNSINHNLVYRVQEDGTCTNHVNSPKTKAGIRIIPMIDEVFDAFLEEYQYQKVIGFCTDEIDGYSGFVFCTGDGKVYLPNAINRTIRSICADYNKEEESKAKEENRDPVLLPKFSCHILRHTFCTRFCENETNLKVIQEIMGHADISTTMDVYAEATQEKKKESMTSLQSALLVR